MDKTLEKLLTPVRLGWHGASIAVFGSYILPEDFYPGFIMLALGQSFWFDAFRSYLRTNRSIQKHGTLDRRIVEPQLTWYCNRQGARTAAANYGLASEFDDIMNNNQNMMFFRYIPHI